MAEDLKGKTALVTGAGKRTGIGFAIAQKLAACGVNVIVTEIASPAAYLPGEAAGNGDEINRIAAELAKDHGVKTLAVELDVTEPASIGRMVETVKQHFDGIHVLVNNAGAAFGALGSDQITQMIFQQQYRIYPRKMT